ncbi:glycosyltransferase family 2 protein [Selenomonas ruminantium]|uniref:Glycosyl transferase family 2 n=1 Tax=Selenomonas ruminantium TaxID=971 RepID=A0A1K1NNM0_SELRU|nr:glycosyltransferase family 2 protein [Selenomonas ruminantium]SFW36919.1 Glycosyl transferase family 2 [Selenomonas ruminantium]
MLKISIITVSFNAAKTIRQTIESVLEQTYCDIEYIIIDGASTDGTVDIVKSYGERIAYWISEPDKGIYDAMNKGIDVATGDYIEFLGADDCLENDDVIQQVVSNLNEDIDVLSAPVWSVFEDNHYQTLCSNIHAVNRNEFKGGMIPHAGMFVKLSLMNKNKFDPSYRISGDYKFFLQCYLNDSVKFKFIDKPVAYFAQSGVSMETENRLKEEQMIHEELGLNYTVRTESNNRKIVKKILGTLGILEPVRNFIRIYFLWEKHKCDNKICRWCGRF